MLPGELWVCTLGSVTMVAVALADGDGNPVLMTCQRPIIINVPRNGDRVTMRVVRYAPGNLVTEFDSEFLVYHNRMVDLSILIPTLRPPTAWFDLGLANSDVVGEAVAMPVFDRPPEPPILWETRIFERRVHHVQLDYSLLSKFEVLALPMDSGLCLPGMPVLHLGRLVGIYSEHKSNANFQSLAKLEFRTPITYQSLDHALCLSVTHVAEFLNQPFATV